MNAIVFIITLFFLTLYTDIYGEALFAGGISSVNAESSFNALRNPALMSHQSSENISFMYLYSYLLNSEVEADLTAGGIAAEVDSSPDEKYNGAVFFSSVSHSDRNSYGFGISKNGEDQITLSSNETKTVLGAYTEDSSEENSQFGADLLFSYSYKLYGHKSLGLQIETSTSYELTEKDRVNNLATVKNNRTEKLKITSGAAMGFSLRENYVEFGAVLKSGNYGFGNQKYELTNNSIHSLKEISNYYIHDEGPGIMIGFELKPLRKLRVSFEGGTTVPFEFEEKSCDEDTLAVNTSDINVIYTALTRAGVNYKYNRFLNIGFGGSFVTYKARSSGNDGLTTGSSSISLYQISAGADIIPAKNYNLLIGINYKRIEINSEFGNASRSMDLMLVRNSVEAICGVSFNY